MNEYLKLVENNVKRKIKMVALRAAGLTMQEIADKFGISKQRVSKILKDK